MLRRYPARGQARFLGADYGGTAHVSATSSSHLAGEHSPHRGSRVQPYPRHPYTIEDVSPTDAPRDGVAAMLAARQELGPDYEQALIDGFVTRIGQAIDERVEARLAEVRPSLISAQPPLKSGRRERDNSQLILALGSLGFAVPLSAFAAG